MTAVLLSLAAAVVLVLAGLGLFLYLLVKHTPVDRYEDGAQSDADVQRIKDSMRGELL